MTSKMKIDFSAKTFKNIGAISPISFLIKVFFVALLPFVFLFVYQGGLGHKGHLVLICVWLPFVFTAAAFIRSLSAGILVISLFSVIQAFILVRYPQDPLMELTRQLPSLSEKKILWGIVLASVIILWDAKTFQTLEFKNPSKK